MREAAGRRRMISVLHDHQLGVAQRLFDQVEVRRGGCRIGAENPDRLELSLCECFKLLEGRQSGLRPNASAWDTPKALYFLAIGWIFDASVARQHVR